MSRTAEAKELRRETGKKTPLAPPKHQIRIHVAQQVRLSEKQGMSAKRGKHQKEKRRGLRWGMIQLVDEILESELGSNHTLSGLHKLGQVT